MRTGKRDAMDRPLPPSLVYATALTCAVLAAIATQIQLTYAGYNLTRLWQNLFSAGAMQLGTAGPWWAIAAAAFIVGGITAAALSRLAPPWRRFRFLRWLGGAALVWLLANVGHHLGGLPPEQLGTNTAIGLAVIGIAVFMGFCGAYLTVRR
jgi:hypothetical protein